MDFSSMCKNWTMIGHVKLLKHNFVFLEKKYRVQVIVPFEIGQPKETIWFFYPVSIPLINQFGHCLMDNKIKLYKKVVQRGHVVSTRLRY